MSSNSWLNGDDDRSLSPPPALSRSGGGAVHIPMGAPPLNDNDTATLAPTTTDFSSPVTVTATATSARATSAARTFAQTMSTGNLSRHQSLGNVVQAVIEANRVANGGHHRRRATLSRIQKMPKVVYRQLKPMRIPFVKRFVKWGRAKWPGNKQYKQVLHSHWFFIYVISMSLVQAFLSALSLRETQVTETWNIGTVVSLAFFIFYILEVMMRVYIKGFEFFLSIYNLAETSITCAAFILDLQLNSTTFVANVLSLRVICRVPGIDFLINGIRLALPRISVVLFPLLILIYVFGVIATSTLGPSSYEYPSEFYWHDYYNVTLDDGTTIIQKGANLPYDYYGTIAKSMFTLFQVMTGDAWSDMIARPTMATRPWSSVLFVTFVGLFSFVLLNIFTGIMVDAIQSFERTRNANRIQKTLNPAQSHASDDAADPLSSSPRDKHAKSGGGASEEILKTSITGGEKRAMQSCTTSLARPKSTHTATHVYDDSGTQPLGKTPTVVVSSENTLASTETTVASVAPSSESALLENGPMPLVSTLLLQELRKLREEVYDLRTMVEDRVVAVDTHFVDVMTEG